MKIIDNFEKLNELDVSMGTSIAIGKFDGFHIGHAELIQEITKDACSGVICFDKLPARVLKLISEKGKLMSTAEKYEIMSQSGVDFVIPGETISEVFDMSADEFVSQILKDKLNANKVVCGNDFAYGKNKSGNVDKLIDAGKKYNFRVVVSKEVCYGNNKVSSTRIREAIASGDIWLANAMLGRAYRISGTVIRGNMIGRTIDFPTINVKIDEDRAIPKYGVYYSRVKVDSCYYDGISNIGVKPTVESNGEVLCETHMLNCNQNMYGKHADIDLLDFVRSERKFDSLEKLKEQIEKDIAGIHNCGKGRGKV